MSLKVDVSNNFHKLFSFSSTLLKSRYSPDMGSRPKVFIQVLPLCFENKKQKTKVYPTRQTRVGMVLGSAPVQVPGSSGRLCSPVTHTLLTHWTKCVHSGPGCGSLRGVLAPPCHTTGAEPKLTIASNQASNPELSHGDEEEVLCNRPPKDGEACTIKRMEKLKTFSSKAKTLKQGNLVMYSL